MLIPMEDIPEAIRKLDQMEAKDRLKAGFDAMDAKILASLPDDQLATFQASYAPNTPQFIRAEHEWQRRLLERELRGLRFAAWMGIVGTLAGVFLGWVLFEFF
jgi:hypothetical protein